MPGNQATPDGEVELKVGYMTKRSQGKSALGAINFKKRVFVLTPNRLAYFDGTLEVRERERRKRNECVCVCVGGGGGGGGGKVCVCVCVREREREREKRTCPS